MSGGWAGSTRRDTLPTNWRTEIRPTVLQRDGHQCTWLEGHDDGGYPTYLAGDYLTADRCNDHGRDVDHVGDPHDHSPTNLRTLCTWHHNRRSSRQGNTNQRRHSTSRPREPHPGLLPPPVT